VSSTILNRWTTRSLGFKSSSNPTSRKLLPPRRWADAAVFVGSTQLAPSWHRNLLLRLCGLYIVLVGVSRIHTGGHWPSDVLGGVLLGSIFLVWMILFYEWLQVRFFAVVSTPEGSTNS
jgi:hypothetical protein